MELRGPADLLRFLLYIDLGSIIHLIDSIEAGQRTPGRRHIEVRAADENGKTCWSTVQHAAARLVSYKYAVETLILAHHIWAETDLFLDFDVEFVPSSARHKYPAKMQAQPASEIIGRMTSSDRLPEYRAHAVELEKHDLEKRIQEQWKYKFRPVVHAEVLLLDWMMNTEGGIGSARFFKQYRYIGSSKPTCRLCSYYFDTAARSVGVRPSHGNIYYPWRLPDVRRREGEDTNSPEVQRCQENWHRVMLKIKERVCGDGLQLLEEKVSYKKDHDSNTFTTRILETESVRALPNRSAQTSWETDSLAGLEGGFQEMSIHARAAGDRS